MTCKSFSVFTLIEMIIKYYYFQAVKLPWLSLYERVPAEYKAVLTA